MKQALKNKYYSLIEINDYPTLELINFIFSKMDTILLTEPGRNHQEEFFDLISVLEFTEEALYQEMNDDIIKGVLS